MKPRHDAAIFLCILCALLCLPPGAGAATRYVNLNSTNPVQPFTSWTTAARTIQAACDISADGDLVLVTNGYYQTGGTTNFPEYSSLTNRLSITNAITVQSVNGPNVTFIRGDGPWGDAAIRCVFMAPGSTLSGFTITNGYTRLAGDYYDERSGGGVWCSDVSCVLTNCIITDNVAAKVGGGVFQGTLYNCTVKRNYSSDAGGGVWQGVLNACSVRDNFSFLGGGTYYSTLYNSTLSSNMAYRGGGAEGGDLFHCSVVTNWALQSAGGVFYGRMVNCIVYYNECTNNPNWEGGWISYTCTEPLPEGEGNITNAPAFVSIPAHNFRLTAASPCIDTGTNDVALLDKDGVPRPLDGNDDALIIADMGAYEFVNPYGDTDGDGMLDGYEIDYRLDPNDPADAALDPDGDWTRSGDEFIAGTDPNNPASCFRLTRVGQQATNELVTWSSATGRVYVLQRSVNLAAGTWTNVAIGLRSWPPANTYTDASPIVTFPCFYRVWVQRTNAYYPP